MHTPLPTSAVLLLTSPALLQLQPGGKPLHLCLSIPEAALHQPQLGISSRQLPLQLLTAALKHQPHLPTSGTAVTQQPCYVLHQARALVAAKAIRGLLHL
jgi:hypothetical protein